jgi:hypothetical protein
MTLPCHFGQYILFRTYAARLTRACARVYVLNEVKWLKWQKNYKQLIFLSLLGPSPRKTDTGDNTPLIR